MCAIGAMDDQVKIPPWSKIYKINKENNRMQLEIADGYPFTEMRDLPSSLLNFGKHSPPHRITYEVVAS
jgi:hypothetical protein